MNGTVEGKAYQFNTVLRVDKASVISLTDDSFDDWDLVTYPDFQLEGKDHVIGGKMDYDANYVYIYIEYDTVGTNGLASSKGRSWISIWMWTIRDQQVFLLQLAQISCLKAIFQPAGSIITPFWAPTSHNGTGSISRWMMQFPGLQ